MFRDCKCIEDVKKLFRELAKKLHPDNGGDVKAFQKMKLEYEQAFNRFKNIHRNHEGGYYEKETTETAQEFADIIEKVINLDGIAVEICGDWVWITGHKTKDHKEIFKRCGFRWSQNKQAWYYHEGTYRRWHGRKSYTMDDIRTVYGSRKVKEEEAA